MSLKTLPSDTADALPAPLRREFEANQLNPCVGQVLVSEDARARVWFIRLAPGERLPFHRHVLDYFWTALSHGRARSHLNGQPAAERAYAPGETAHQKFGAGEFMVHDLENVGDGDLAFLTVEHLESANPPLPLPDGVRPTGSMPAASFP